MTVLRRPTSTFPRGLVPEERGPRAAGPPLLIETASAAAPATAPVKGDCAALSSIFCNERVLPPRFPPLVPEERESVLDQFVPALFIAWTATTRPRRKGASSRVLGPPLPAAEPQPPLLHITGNSLTEGSRRGGGGEMRRPSHAPRRGPVVLVPRCGRRA